MEKVCIVCPRGCNLNYEYMDGELVVTNNGCKRGPEYLSQELVAPKRMLTTTVKVVGGEFPVVPVHAGEYVDKEDVELFIKYLKSVEVQAPVECNMEILNSINGKEVKVLTSRDIKKA